MPTRQVKVQIVKKDFNHINCREKMPTLAGIRHLSIHFFSQKPRLFHLSTEHVRPNPSEMNIKKLIPRRNDKK